MYFCLKLPSASSWGCELKYLLVDVDDLQKQSASSWGCELKCNIRSKKYRNTGQPLREAVSWNIEFSAGISYGPGQPLREAVSWNSNSITGCFGRDVSLFVRLWVEMMQSGWHVWLTRVSLFVRLWVEIRIQPSWIHWYPSSASSWGCELKWLWAADMTKTARCQPLREAVSWNSHASRCLLLSNSQPLREAVSWNLTMLQICLRVLSSASSWGCELKYDRILESYKGIRQPLREAVSWNYVMIPRAALACQSASSWGCELKCWCMYNRWNIRMSASSWGCELK